VVRDRDGDIIGVVVVVGTVVRVVIVDADRVRDVDMEGDGSKGHRTLTR